MAVNMENNNKYLLVEESALSEKIIKTMEVKKMLSCDAGMTIDEAVKAVGISRSTFYKYKDSVFPFYETVRGKVITLFFVVENFSGILSNIIEKIAVAKANIITINQNIPINGLADITISVETAGMIKEVNDLINDISGILGVRRYEILSRE
jgi:chorismate mutase